MKHLEFWQTDTIIDCITMHLFIKPEVLYKAKRCFVFPLGGTGEKYV